MVTGFVRSVNWEAESEIAQVAGIATVWAYEKKDVMNLLQDRCFSRPGRRDARILGTYGRIIELQHGQLPASFADPSIVHLNRLWKGVGK